MEQQVYIKEEQLVEAAQKGVDDFLNEIVTAIKKAGNNILDSQAFNSLNGDQITLWGYFILRDELMDGGFIQLIYNGYGPFFFENPFAKAMRMWGLKDFSKLIYKAKSYYDLYKDELEKPCSDENFMALFEKYPEFDTLDDRFVEEEEDITNHIAHYVDEHIERFVTIEK